MRISLDLYSYSGFFQGENMKRGKKELDQKERRDLLWSLLGDLPPRCRKISARKLSEDSRGSYILEKLELYLNGIEPVPAFFVRPRVSRGRIPAILYNHVHGGAYEMGKEELVEGWRGLQAPPYAEELTSRGWAALAIDAWNFGERHKRTESSLFKEMLWKGRVLWGMMVYDSIRAMDYLAGRPEVDPGRIGTLGMSMGSTMAWWAAALDERIKVCADICCLTDFEELIKENGLDAHGLFYFVPGLLKHFRTETINDLIAPRPHLSLAGNMDPLTPAAGLDKIDRHLKETYEKMGAREAWRLFRENSGHEETPAMRAEILKWFDRWL